MTSLTYPDGEAVSYTYTPQGPVQTAIGKDTYVGDTQYNALGQVELRKLGSAAGVVTTDYSYRSDNFRLQWLKSGTVSPYEGPAEAGICLRRGATWTGSRTGSPASRKLQDL